MARDLTIVDAPPPLPAPRPEWKGEACGNGRRAPGQGREGASGAAGAVRRPLRGEDWASAGHPQAGGKGGWEKDSREEFNRDFVDVSTFLSIM